jgi:hypothetical protein
MGLYRASLAYIVTLERQLTRPFKKVMPVVFPGIAILFIRVLANQYFLYRLSEAGNIKYCYELHARGVLRFTIRHQEDA